MAVRRPGGCVGLVGQTTWVSEQDVQRVCINEFHKDAMPRVVDWLGDREAVFVQDGHECPFFLSSEPRHVHPGRRLALAHVVPLFFDGPEGYPTEA